MTKKKVNRAAVLPYYIKENKPVMLFMKPSDPKFGGDGFQLAKGKQETNETSLEAGLREAGEELGLFTGNIEHTHLLGRFLGRTDVYIVKIKDPTLFGEPHFETKEVRWLTADQFLGEGRDLHKPIIKAAMRYINTKENIKDSE